jgi:hypothetical protein
MAENVAPIREAAIECGIASRPDDCLVMVIELRTAEKGASQK